MSTRLQHWRRIVGPWPIRPGLLTAVAFLYYLAFQAGRQGNTMLLDPSSITGTIIPGLVIASAVFALAAVGRGWQRRHGVTWANYLVILAVITGAAIAFRLTFLPEYGITGVTANTIAFVRFLFTFMLTSTVAGAVVSRLEGQIAATEEALRIAREQQVQLIAADEEARRQVSLLLHDRVQAGLLTTCMELRALARTLPTGERAALDVLIERLESMRSLDVRRAARVLSPNLEDVDLQTALEDLASQYEAVFVTEIVIDPTDERDLAQHWPFTALAIYRIVDQGLINVAAHADARRVVVRVKRDTNGFVVTVQDDGVGLTEPQRPGLGSTLITTWVRAAAGTWSLGPRTEAPGTVLTATLRPVESTPTTHEMRNSG